VFIGTRNRDPKVLSLPPLTLHAISQETRSLNSCAEKDFIRVRIDFLSYPSGGLIA
jgi:hypothetical protein